MEEQGTREILTFGRYLKAKFGRRVVKIPIALPGFTCPNIDGTKARGGCVYCDNDSFSPNARETRSKFTLSLESTENPLIELQLAEVRRQIAQGRERLGRKFKSDLFLAYFQAFTNTYAPLSTLIPLYEEALSQDGVVGLSIGTRTDCVSSELLDWLARKSYEKEIWIEYGVQSLFDETLARINRAQRAKEIKEGIAATVSLGLNVCAHLIYGLPGESEEMMLSTLKQTLALGVKSLKIHPLYAVKNTALANELRMGSFTPLSERRYLKLLQKSFELIPPDISIQRLTAGIGDETLLAPSWCDDKRRQMKRIRAALRSQGIRLY
ncbi:MAG: TIGR01212 family radical SAM protein [Campylobacterales bacterium]